MSLKPSHNGFNLFFVWLIIVFFGVWLKKSLGTHLSICKTRICLSICGVMIVGPLMTVFPWFWKIETNWMWTDIVSPDFLPVQRYGGCGYDKKRGNRIFAPPQEEKDGNPIMLSIHWWIGKHILHVHILLYSNELNRYGAFCIESNV